MFKLRHISKSLDELPRTLSLNFSTSSCQIEKRDQMSFFSIFVFLPNFVIFSDTIFFHKKVSWLWDKKFYVHTKKTILSVCSIEMIVLIFFRKGSLRLRTEKASPKWWKNRSWRGWSNYRGSSLCKFNSPRTS